MKREIKFRQPIFNRDGSFKEFHYWGLGIQQGDEPANVSWCSYQPPITNPRDSQQFTGLKDKNGKEIYEGDLISESGSRPYEVIWQFHSVQWIMQYTGEGRAYRHMAYDYAKMNYEVIGNIHENPDLL